VSAAVAVNARAGTGAGVLHEVPKRITMIPIVTVVGRSDSGKTFVIERLIPILTGRGFRVATVKHDVHGFEVDREGKDSWRHKQAGAATVVLSSGKKIAVMQDVERERTLEEIRMRYVDDVDLILAEGYKRSCLPKVEVALFRAESTLLCGPGDPLVAVVSRRDLSLDVPVFHEEEMDGLADLLEKRFLRKRTPRVADVFVDGKALPLNPFMQEILRKTLQGFLSCLKGWDADARVEVRLAPRPRGDTAARADDSEHEADTGPVPGQD